MRHRKATLVATRLGLTQSSISYSLRRLRDVFGDELFLRRPHGLEPTVRAVELEPRIRAILDMAGQAIAGTAVLDPSSVEGVFRIGASDHVSTLVAAPLLKRLRSSAPGLRLVSRPIVRRAALEGLAANEIDLALGLYWGDVQGFQQRQIFEEGYAVIARHRHPVIGGGGRLSLKDYLAADHVLVSFGGDVFGIVDRVLAARNLSRRVVMAVPFFFPALATVASSDVIATVPRRLALAHAKPFRLQVLDPPLAIRPLRISAVWHPRNAANGLHAWLIERLQEAGGRGGGGKVADVA